MSAGATDLRRTPLYERHVAAGGRMTAFAGWEMPLHYGSQLEEHGAVRHGVGMFDVSHMGEIEIVGPRAADLVQRIVTRDVSLLHDGHEAYGLLCAEDGGMLDDLYVARLGADHWLIVANAATYEADVAHMDLLAAAFAAEAGEQAARVKPVSEEWAMLAVQGPRWSEPVRAVVGPGPWSELPRNRIVRLDWRGRELLLSTTGYTGEPGCEMLCRPEWAGELWDALAAAGARPAGLAARDSLRLEMGYLLSGQDFTREHNPFEARVGWAVQLDKGEFCGRAALAAVARAGVKRRLMGLLPEGRRIPRHGAPIMADGRRIGVVTSGGYSPVLERPIALGYVESPWDRPGERVAVDLGTSSLEACLCKPPFIERP